MSSGVGVMPARIWTPGAVMSGLMTRPAGPRDEKAAMTSPWPSCETPAVNVAVAPVWRVHEGHEGGAVGQVDGRQPVVVGLDVGQRRVVEDHPGGAALEDVEALLDTGVGAALAGDDLAGEQPGRRRGIAQRPAVRGGRRRARSAAATRPRR